MELFQKMNSLIEEIVNLFCRTPRQIQNKETHESFNVEYGFGCLSCPSISELTDIIKRFPSRDIVEIFITINSSDPLTFSTSNLDQWENTLGDLYSQQLNLEQEDTISLKIAISKKWVNNKISVYDLELFVEHLKNRSISEILSIFTLFISKSGVVIFSCFTSDCFFKTNAVLFCHEESITADSFNSQINRQQLLDRRNNVAYFIGGASTSLIPEDFHVIGATNGVPSDLSIVFNSVEKILSLVFIANFTTFENDTSLFFRLQGYKFVSGNIAKSDISELQWDYAFDLYQWAYSGGAISDKIGLLRNIITLHLDNNNKPMLNDIVYKSVRSSHEIYLKENIAQYVEIKNKLAEYLISLKRGVREETGKFSAALFQNLGAFLTFFLSTFMVNAIQGGKFKDVFTRDVTYISYAFLTGSFFYLIVSVFSIYRKMQHVKNDYEELNLQYMGLLDQEDLTRILDKQIYLHNPLAEVKSTSLITGILWFALLLVFALLIRFLSVVKEDGDKGNNSWPHPCYQPELCVISSSKTARN